MVMVDAAAVLFIQWSMYEEPTYADPDAVDDTTKMFNSVAGQLTKFVAQMWMEHNYVWLLNFLVLGMVYLVLIFVLNRFWVATAVFAIITSTYAVANSIKVDHPSFLLIWDSSPAATVGKSHHSSLKTASHWSTAPLPCLSG